MYKDLLEIWKCRWYIYESTKKEIRLKYQGSFLGVLWCFVSPMMTILIYAVVFSNVMKPSLGEGANAHSYVTYLCSGILLWNYFNEIVVRCQTTFLNNKNYIKNLKFPIICLPITEVCISFVNLLFAMSVFFLYLFVMQKMPGIEIYKALISILSLSLIGFGFGVVAGIWNVVYKDAEHITQIVLQLIFWTTPIVYTLNILPRG